MSKRGETRPWRVRFTWDDTGLAGCDTRPTEERANELAGMIRRAAERMGRPVTVTVAHRDTEEKP